MSLCLRITNQKLTQWQRVSVVVTLVKSTDLDSENAYSDINQSETATVAARVRCGNIGHINI